jgi:hypothetical protein
MPEAGDLLSPASFSLGRAKGARPSLAQFQTTMPIGVELNVDVAEQAPRMIGSR